ncbi:protein lines [Harmonia axyridis]|uniref:protein lines n=1 Tax=Harmonia axyridis TaxID=115357 RepID=UPI001E2759E2|nr:protein lines [Harmonia axyridis]XP_045464399.1 protein lines [Harmonia axyridis]
MVLQNRGNNMASEQPLKKKPKIEDVESSDETDFIVNFPADSGLSSLTTLHLSLPANVNEEDISLNNINQQYNDRLPCRTSECSAKNIRSGGSADQTNSATNNIYSYSYHPNNSNISIEPAPNIISVDEAVHNWSPGNRDQIIPVQPIPEYVTQQDSEYDIENGLDEFQNMLVKQCLCGISDELFQNPFEGYQLINPVGIRCGMLTEWPTSKILHFLSNLQLVFEIYIKQNNRGFICSKILDLCNSIMVNEYNLMEQILSLCDTRNKYINFMSAKVVSSFFIIAKTELNNEWLETLYGFLTLDNVDYIKMNFTLEIIKRVVEWKDADTHVLEESNLNSSETKSNIDCSTVPYSDSESFDTSNVKGLIIRNLTVRWQILISKIRFLIDNNTNVQAQTCIITFLELWENTISVRNNLSVIDTKPFYAHLETFLSLLNNSLPSIIWKQLLSLFNEVLCYGSTLALQSLIPDDTCRLAHFVIRFVKDHSLLDSLPLRRNEGYTVSSLVGTIPSTHPSQSNMDKTLLQKMVLLVLKSVALSIKETKSDSSDSSIGSDDSDYNQDMLVIGRSMKDVLKKLDIFLKNNLEFHPETPFSNILVHLFSDQDDYLIESMVCTLDIIVGIPDRCAVYPELFNMLNPSYTFVEFLKVVGHGSDLLLDYLVSNETCFLLYLLRFLKYVRKNWSIFMRCCREASLTNSNEFDNAMRVLTQLYDQIARLVLRQLFPYNIDPILRLLKGCMNLYEGGEYS